MVDLTEGTNAIQILAFPFCKVIFYHTWIASYKRICTGLAKALNKCQTSSLLVSVGQAACSETVSSLASAWVAPARPRQLPRHCVSCIGWSALESGFREWNWKDHWRWENFEGWKLNPTVVNTDIYAAKNRCTVVAKTRFFSPVKREGNQWHS